MTSKPKDALNRIYKQELNRWSSVLKHRIAGLFFEFGLNPFHYDLFFFQKFFYGFLHKPHYTDVTEGVCKGFNRFYTVKVGREEGQSCRYLFLCAQSSTISAKKIHYLYF